MSTTAGQRPHQPQARTAKIQDWIPIHTSILVIHQQQKSLLSDFYQQNHLNYGLTITAHANNVTVCLCYLFFNMSFSAPFFCANRQKLTKELVNKKYKNCGTNICVITLKSSEIIQGMVTTAEMCGLWQIIKIWHEKNSFFCLALYSTFCLRYAMVCNFSQFLYIILTKTSAVKSTTNTDASRGRCHVPVSSQEIFLCLRCITSQFIEFDS